MIKILTNSKIPGIEGKDIYIPFDDLPYDKIINFYSKNLFGCFSLDDKGFTKVNVQNEIAKIFTTYSSILKKYEVVDIFFITINNIDGEVRNYLENQVSNALGKLSKPIKFHIDNLNKYYAEEKSKNISHDLNEKFQTIIDDALNLLYKDIIAFDSKNELDYIETNINPNLNDKEKNKLKTEIRDNLKKYLMKISENNIFTGISIGSLIIQRLKNNYKWDNDSYLYEQFENIGIQNININDLVGNLINESEAYLNVDELITIYNQIRVFKSTIERMQEQQSLSEYQNMKGIIAEFWLDKIINADVGGFSNLKIIIFYHFYLKEIGITFFKLFADARYYVFRDLYFPGIKMTDVEKSQFDGLTHYDISKKVFQDFNLPEIFYSYDSEGHFYGNKQIKIISDLVEHTLIKIDTKQNSLYYEISNEAVIIFKNLVDSKFNDQEKIKLEKDILDAVKTNINNYVKSNTLRSVVNVYSYMFENYKLSDELFIGGSEFEEERNNYIKHTRFTLLKNFIIYTQNIDELNIKVKPIIKFIEIIFLSGPYSSRAFLAYELCTWMNNVNIKESVLDMLIETHKNDITLKNDNNKINEKYLNFLKSFRDRVEKNFDLLFLEKIIKECQATSFSGLAVYFKLIYEIISDKIPDDNKTNLIHNPYLKNEIENVIAYIKSGKTDIINIGSINPFIRNSIMT